MAGFTVRTSILPLLLAIPAYASVLHQPKSTDISTTCTTTTEATPSPTAKYYNDEEDGEVTYRVAGYHSLSVSKKKNKHHGYNTSYGSDLEQQYTAYADYESSVEPTGYPVSTDLPLELYGDSSNDDNGDDNYESNCKCTVSVYPAPIYFPDVYTVHPDSTSQFAAEITANAKNRPVVVKYVTALPTSVITYGNNNYYATVTAGTPAVHYSVDMNYGDCPAPTKTSGGYDGYAAAEAMETVVIGNDKTHGRKCLKELIPENNCMTYTIMQEPPMRTKTVLCKLDAKVTGIGKYIPGIYNGYDGYDREHSYSTGVAEEEEEGEPTGLYAQDFEDGESKDVKDVPAVKTPEPTPMPAPAPVPAPAPAPAAPAPAPPAWSKSPEVYNSMTKALASMPTDAQKNVMFQNSASGMKGIGIIGTAAVIASVMLLGMI